MPVCSHNRAASVFGDANLDLAPPANAAHDAAPEFGDDHGGRDALAQGVLLESIDGLRLASELITDHKARASLSRLADELTAVSDEAWTPSDSRVLN